MSLLADFVTVCDNFFGKSSQILAVSLSPATRPQSLFSCGFQNNFPSKKSLVIDGIRTRDLSITSQCFFFEDLRYAFAHSPNSSRTLEVVAFFIS
jgi:hypothetical protein